MDKINSRWFVEGKYAVLQLENISKDSDENEQDIKIDIVFCQDVSGSMSSSVHSQDKSWYGTKLQLCQETQKFVISKLNKNRVGLVTFDSNVKEVYKLDSIVSISDMNRIIMSIYPGSCTNFSGGLHQSLKMIEQSDESSVKYLIVFTDGLPNEGITTDEGLIALINEHVPAVKGGMKLVILGYGEDCNSTLLQRLADEVDGSYHHLSNAEDIPKAIGEEFGTAIQTRQQNLSLKFNPSVMVCQDFKTSSDTIEIGDLLKSETRKLLFEIKDQEAFIKEKTKLNFLDCETAKSYNLEIQATNLEIDPIKVGDAINIKDVGDTTEKASSVGYKERATLLQECLKRIQNSSSSNTETSSRLIEGLERQIKLCQNDPLAPPTCLRSFSSATKKQRGGIYSAKAVADFRDLSTIEVSRAVSEGFYQGSGGPSHNVIFNTDNIFANNQMTIPNNGLIPPPLKLVRHKTMNFSDNNSAIIE